MEEDTIEEKVEQAILDAKDAAKKMGAHYKEPKDWNQKDDEKETKKDSDKEASDEEEMTPERQREIDEQKMSKRKLKEKYRPTLSALKQMAQKPDVVEMHDVTSADPRLLVHLKGYRNLVPVPRHWCLKRRYLTSKRGFEKPPFELPEFIKRTGISELSGGGNLCGAHGLAVGELDFKGLNQFPNSIFFSYRFETRSWKKMKFEIERQSSVKKCDLNWVKFIWTMKNCMTRFFDTRPSQI